MTLVPTISGWPGKALLCMLCSSSTACELPTLAPELQDPVPSLDTPEQLRTMTCDRIQPTAGGREGCRLRSEWT